VKKSNAITDEVGWREALGKPAALVEAGRNVRDGI
jgi:hypothetical protein